MRPGARRSVPPNPVSVSASPYLASHLDTALSGKVHHGCILPHLTHSSTFLCVFAIHLHVVWSLVTAENPSSSLRWPDKALRPICPPLGSQRLPRQACHNLSRPLPTMFFVDISTIIVYNPIKGRAGNVRTEWRRGCAEGVALSGHGPRVTSQESHCGADQRLTLSAGSMPQPSRRQAEWKETRWKRLNSHTGKCCCESARWVGSRGGR